jgi:copper chaperone CopZ
MSQQDPADPYARIATDQPVLENAVIAVEGLDDPHRAARIEAALRDLNGVESAVADLDRAEVRVTFDARKTHVPALHDAILRTGYRPTAEADNS